MRKEYYAASRIDWDADYPEQLPQTVGIPRDYLIAERGLAPDGSDETALDMIADVLSDAYGWCVKRFDCSVETFRDGDELKTEPFVILAGAGNLSLSDLATAWFKACSENGIDPASDEGFDFESWLADNGYTVPAAPVKEVNPQ